MANVQIWDAAFSADDVLYDYLNPEQLALNRGGTSLTESNLKIWYPMQDGHRGQQSFVLDGSNVGLGDELISNGDFATGDLDSIKNIKELTYAEVSAEDDGYTDYLFYPLSEKNKKNLTAFLCLHLYTCLYLDEKGIGINSLIEKYVKKTITNKAQETFILNGSLIVK